MADHAEPTMTKPTAPARPLAVRLVQGQALVYIMLAVAGLITVLYGFWNHSSGKGNMRGFDEQIVAEYVFGDCKVIKCLRSGNATVGFYHAFYGYANGTTNLLLITRARNLEPECKWVKTQTAMIEPLAPADFVRVAQGLPYIKSSSTNNGTALCVEFQLPADRAGTWQRGTKEL